MTKPDEVAQRLNALSTSLSANGNKGQFSDHWSWQASAVNVDDLAVVAKQLAERLSHLTWEKPSDEQNLILDRILRNVNSLMEKVVPNLFSGFQASEAVVSTLFAIDRSIDRLAGDPDMASLTGVSHRMKKRISLIDLRLSDSLASMEGIESKLEQIQKAHAAAEDLPITERQLSEAIAQVEKHRMAIQKAEISIDNSEKGSVAALGKIQTADKIADEYLSKIKASYRAVTSQGLAQAFSDRQHELNQSMLIWVLGLMAALVLAAVIGGERFPLIISAVTGKPDWGVVIVNVVLAGLTLAPAVWFAWVATTQIGQRFRLSEDYAYKAAISAAYEGYRTEAASLDPLLEAQLFASALGRLDEIPLRLVQEGVAGSPMHELLSSAEFKEAAQSIPGLLERALQVLKRGKKTESKSFQADPQKE